jgi:hypothetical protein
MHNTTTYAMSSKAMARGQVEARRELYNSPKKNLLEVVHHMQIQEIRATWRHYIANGSSE